MIDEINPNVLRTTILNGGYEAAFRGLRNTTENADKNQCNVPWIILFDPTSACNKHCVGCWAAEYGNRLNLTYDEMDKLISEAEALGTHLFMWRWTTRATCPPSRRWRQTARSTARAHRV